MQATETLKFKLSKAEVEDAIIEYLKLRNKLAGGEKIKTLTDVKKSEEVPGMDIHDCSYIYHFDGIEIVFEDEVNHSEI